MLVGVQETILPPAAMPPLPTPARGADIFDGLTPQQQRTLRAIKTETRVCDRDMQLVRAQAALPGLLLIQSGWAYRYRLLTDGRRQILDLLLPGDTAGLDSLMSGMAGSAIQTATSVRYLAFDREQTTRLLAEEGWFRQRAMEALMQDRRRTEIAVARLGQGSAEERIASVFLEIHERLARQNLAADGSFTMGLTQNHLSDLIGLTPVHLSRVLQRLRARRVLSVSGRNVTLLDIPALERLAPF